MVKGDRIRNKSTNSGGRERIKSIFGRFGSGLAVVAALFGIGAIFKTSASGQTPGGGSSGGETPPPPPPPVTVEKIPPLVAITAPAQGAQYQNGATVQITGTAYDNAGLNKVEIKIDRGTVNVLPFTLVQGLVNWNYITSALVQAGAYTVTARATDINANLSGTRTVSFTILEAAQPPPPPPPPPPPVGTTNDKYGVRMLYPTAAGGRIWFNKWDNGIARSFGDLPIKKNDPYDPEFITERTDADGSLSGLGDGTYTTAGDGILKITGIVPRMYVFDVNRDWGNVEITVYGMRISDDNIDYSGIKVAMRADHGAINNEDTQPCDNRGYALAILDTGDALIEKETCHHCPNGYAQVQRTQIFTNPKALPFGRWIGMKAICRDIATMPGAVKLEIWADKNAINDWQKITEYVDTGVNFGVANDPCKPGVNPALALTTSNNRPGSETGRPNVSIYFRCDNVHQDGLLYKWASIRTIDPA